MKNRRLVAGFTLIELLVTIAIIGILLAVAVPNYFNSVRKSNRVEAKTFMVEAAHKLQRCYTSFGRYDHDDCDIYQQLSGDGMQSEGNGSKEGKGLYDITVEPDGDLPATSSYLLKATAREDGSQHKDIEVCRVLIMNQQGVTSPKECW